MPKKHRVVSAISWSATSFALRNGFSFLIVVILARILAPGDFGLIALLAIFIGTASAITDGAFSQALIQRQDVSATDESSIFYFNILIAVITASLLSLLAPLIADFYQQPVLRTITIALAVTLVINAFGSVHSALVIKRLDLKTVTKVEVAAIIISGLVTVAMALQGYGVWSLVGRALTHSLATSSLYWLLHPWRPKAIFSWQVIRSYSNFSGFMMLSRVISSIYMGVFTMVIGKTHSPDVVGFYTNAIRIQQLPTGLSRSVIAQVAFPLFSESTGDSAKLVLLFRQAIVSILLTSIPLAVAFFLAAEPIVLILLGEQWRESVPILQVLSPVVVLIPLQSLNFNLLKALDKMQLQFRLMIVKLIVVLVLLYMAVPFGIMVIAAALVSGNLFNVLINFYYTWKMLR